MSSNDPAMRRIPLLLVFVVLLGAGLAGCTRPADDDPAGDGDGGDDGDLALVFYDDPELGPILADPEGVALYIFTNDDPGRSNCYEQCAANWPPYMADAVPDAPDAVADDLSLVDRDDGTSQLAYRDRPLYYFVSDTEPGQTSGDGRGGVWFVVREPPEDPEMLDGAGPNEVATEEIAYHGEATGFLATPADQEATSGIVMIHEWWGLNDHIRDMARLLATHGYSVLAVDLFNGSVASDPDQALAQVQGLDQEAANDNLQAAADLLRDRGATRVSSLGWCFGGGQSLQLALTGEDLAATVIYYGNLVTDEARLDVIDQPVLGIFGEDDGSIPPRQARAFGSALDNLSIENQIYIYPDVGHAFANPSGGNWGAEEAQDAWARTLAFLRTYAPPV